MVKSYDKSNRYSMQCTSPVFIVLHAWLRDVAMEKAPLYEPTRLKRDFFKLFKKWNDQFFCTEMAKNGKSFVAAWETRHYSSVASLGDAASICSPSASSPDRGRATVSEGIPSMMSPGAVSILGPLPLCNTLLCSGVSGLSFCSFDALITCGGGSSSDHLITYDGGGGGGSGDGIVATDN